MTMRSLGDTLPPRPNTRAGTISGAAAAAPRAKKHRREYERTRDV